MHSCPLHPPDRQTSAVDLLTTGPMFEQIPPSICRERNKHLRDEQDIRFQVSGQCPLRAAGGRQGLGSSGSQSMLGLVQESPEAWGLAAPSCGQDGGIRYFKSSKGSG